MNTLEEIRNYFKDDLFATEAAGIKIVEVCDGMAECHMPIKPIHRNAAGAVMGGAIFTLADFAFACASHFERKGAVTLQSSVSYLHGAKGDVLIARARMVSETRGTCYYIITVTDELGTAVASVATTGYKIRD